MELKGFITGSLVTLGVVGLVAALKEADIFDDCDSICMEDDDADGDSEGASADGGHSDASESAEEGHGATSGTVNFNAEKLAKTAKEIAAKLGSLKSAADSITEDERRQVCAEIDGLKEALEKLIESLEKTDAA